MEEKKTGIVIEQRTPRGQNDYIYHSILIEPYIQERLCKN